MHYVHHSALEHPGRLTSKCCFLDTKFTCKIGRYWLNSLSVLATHNTDIINSDGALWIAPEVLRGNFVTGKSDIYSFGIMIQEVLLRGKPYAANKCRRQMTSRNLSLHMVPGRCWHEDPNLRPLFSNIRDSLIMLNGGKDINAVESMVSRIEIHTQHLEDGGAEVVSIDGRKICH